MKCKEEEVLENYRIGGFHPAFIGEILAKRYVLIKKIGKGNYSNCWMAKDCKTDMIVALKIHKSSPYYYESALEECEILQMVSKKMITNEWNDEMRVLIKNDAYKNEGFCVRMLNSFVHFGPLGNHFCMVFEIHGPSLSYIMEVAEEEGVVIEFMVIQKIMKQILASLHFIHSQCGVIHTDIKEENFLFSLPYKDLETILLDELEKEDKFIEFRSSELKQNIKLERAKVSYEKNLENLSKKERKKLRRKMKKMEKKLQKNKEKQIEVIKEEKMERIKDEIKLDLKDNLELNTKSKPSQRRSRRYYSVNKFTRVKKKGRQNVWKRSKSHNCKIFTEN